MRTRAKNACLLMGKPPVVNTCVRSLKGSRSIRAILPKWPMGKSLNPHGSQPEPEDDRHQERTWRSPPLYAERFIGFNKDSGRSRFAPAPGSASWYLVAPGVLWIGNP